MKTVSIVSATAIGLTLTVGIAFGSINGYDCRGWHDSELTLAAAPAFGSVGPNKEKGYSGIEWYESKIEGTINRISRTATGFWFVDEKPVFITPATVVSESLGKAELGARVEIFGTYVGRILNAYRIDVKEDKN